MATNGSASCGHYPDNSWGPVVDDCERAFDFTLLFEESILSILPSAILLLLAPVRLVSLSRRKRVVGGHALRYGKLAAIAAYGALQVAILALWAIDSTHKTQTSIAAAALNLVNSLVFMALSFTEHSKSLKPSGLLNAYLFFSVLFDIVRTRTLWMMNFEATIPAIFSASLGLKIAILILEEVNKTRYIDASVGEAAAEETAGIFSRTLFWWLNRLIRTGFSKVLTVDGLPPIDRRLCSEALLATFTKRWEEAPKEGDNILMITVFKSLLGPLLAPVIPLLCIIALTLAQPLMLQTFLQFLGEPEDGTQKQKNRGWGLVGAYGIVYVSVAFATAWSQRYVYRFVSMVRGILVTTLYRKTTSVSIVGLDDAAAVTLMSTDVERIVAGLAMMHEIWTTLIQIAVSLFLLYRLVWVAIVVPLFMFILCGLATGVLAGQAGQRQAKWMEAIEKRVGVTSSMLGSMKGVKMSGLTGKLSSIITNLRLAEIASARLYRMMLVYVVTLSYTPSTFSPVITFAAYAKIADNNGTVLDSTRIFTTLSLIALITEPLTALIHALPEFFTAVACFNRIQKFLLAAPRSDTRQVAQVGAGAVVSVTSRHSDTESDPELQLKHQEAGELEKPQVLGKGDFLQGEAISIRDGRFGWKSGEDEVPLLKDVNLVVPTSQLTVVIGPVGCGKSTLLKAILGETPVAEGSVLLSTKEMGFCDQTPWLTNQTLQANVTGFSKYDANWYASVIRACALDQDLAQLPEGDQSMIGSKGITLSGGQKQRVAIARAVYARRPIAVFDDVFSGLDSETQKHVFDHVFGVHGLLRSQGTTVILATHAVHLLPYADSIVALDPEGRVAAQGTFSQLNAPDGYIRRYGLESLKEEATASKAEADDEAKKVDPLHNPEEENIPKAMDDEARRLGDRTVYKYYFQQIGTFNTVVFFGALLIWMVLLKFPEIWLKWWGDANVRNGGAENGKYLGVYTLFQVGSLLALAFDVRHLLLVIVVVSGKKLHSSLLRTVLHAPMSFFATTDVGSIINRFSQDIQLIDAELPIAFLNTCANGFAVIAQAIMLIPASYWLVLTYPFLFGILWAVQKYYLRTSRQLRFLDLEAKSPLYSQFLETLGGLTTIRAFQWQDELVSLNDRRLDFSQKPFYLLFSVQRWLNLVLDLITSALAVILTAVSINLRGQVSPGFAGVALYNVMTLSAAMKAAVTVWTVLETSIGAVARVKSFDETTPSEHLPEETGSLPDNWPSKGAIELSGVAASYNEDLPNVLNNISLSIKPGENIGICGRSGSGKSSLILAIFRMIELKQGTIRIDDVDIATIPRGTLRERLNAIPQDPFFLSGTVRENCDPRGTSTDEQIQDALRKVQLWDLIESKGGLDTDLTQDFFSHGQRQLFCLARAILHPSKIVIMDEATSNVDVDTDKIMQEVIRTAFANATIVAVAHRLDTILDFNSVVVVDKGVVTEHGNPLELLARPSAFKTLYDTYDGAKEETSASAAAATAASEEIVKEE